MSTPKDSAPPDVEFKRPATPEQWAAQFKALFYCEHTEEQLADGFRAAIADAQVDSISVPPDVLRQIREAMERMLTTHGCSLAITYGNETVTCADCDDARAALSELRRLAPEGVK